MSKEFKDLQISPRMSNALQLLNYTQPTPVQQSVIPLLLNYKDVVVESITGSGKTLSFLVPVIELLLQRQFSIHQVGCIIISPTRELAIQTHKVLVELLECMQTSISSMLCIGGTDIRNDLDLFKKRGGCILIGTPGRLEDIINRPICNTKTLEILIMDEADRLLDLGFEKQMNSILRKVPKQRRTGLFSATMTSGLHSIIKTGLRNPVKVLVQVETLDGTLVEELKIPSTLSIECILLNKPTEKLMKLVELLKEWKDEKVIVYFSTSASVDYYFKVFTTLFTNIKIFSLHGKMVPKKRSLTYSSFTQHPSAILFCTDVAARGIDLVIDKVIQYDPPTDPSDFQHRCGRTGRAGRVGKAVVLLVGCEDTFIHFLNVRGIRTTTTRNEVSGGTNTMNEVNSIGKRIFTTERSTMSEVSPEGYNTSEASLFNTTVGSMPKGQENCTSEASILNTSDSTMTSTNGTNGTTTTTTNTTKTTTSEIVEQLKQLSLSDRDILEKVKLSNKGVKGFVSWVRAYTSHHAKFIFKLSILF